MNQSYIETTQLIDFKPKPKGAFYTANKILGG